MVPTRIRFVVIGLTTLVAVLLYLDRICLSIAATYVREDLGLSRTEMSWVLSSFFITYAIGQVPTGFLSDRYGARLMLALYLFLWSAFTGLMGLATGLLGLLILRLGCGLTEAGAYPSSAGLISKWVPLNRRATASGFVSVGGRLGGTVAPILTAFLIVALTPASKPAHLTANDLLDPLKAAQGIVLDADTPAGRAAAGLRERLSADTLAAVHRIAALKPDELEVPAPSDLAALLGGLNDLIRGADLVPINESAGVDVPPEAKQIGTVPEADRATAQHERRNRLALEAILPDGVRKIYGGSWRWALAVYGLAGIIVAAIFFALFRNSPREHPGVNEAELALIEAGRPSQEGKAQSFPYRGVLTDPSLWLCSIAQFATNFGWAVLITWLPDYLAEAHNAPLERRGLIQTIVIFVGLIGMFLGGGLCDTLTAWLGRRWGRMLPMALSRFVVAAAFFAVPGLDTVWAVTAALALTAFATDLGTPATWAYCQDVGGRHVGSILGWANMWGNLGAFASPVVLELVRQSYGWNGVFWACGGSFVVAGVTAFGIDASRPLRGESA